MVVRGTARRRMCWGGREQVHRKPLTRGARAGPQRARSTRARRRPPRSTPEGRLRGPRPAAALYGTRRCRNMTAQGRLWGREKGSFRSATARPRRGDRPQAHAACASPVSSGGQEARQDRF